MMWSFAKAAWKIEAMSEASSTVAGWRVKGMIND